MKNRQSQRSSTVRLNITRLCLILMKDLSLDRILDRDFIASQREKMKSSGTFKKKNLWMISSYSLQSARSNPSLLQIVLVKDQSMINHFLMLITCQKTLSPLASMQVNRKDQCIWEEGVLKNFLQIRCVMLKKFKSRSLDCKRRRTKGAMRRQALAEM